MSSVVESSCCSAPATNNSHETSRDEKKNRILSCGHSTESEGPLIVINDTTTDSEGESTDNYLSHDEFYQKLRLVSLSGCESVQSSGTELTSEGGESEVERRPLTSSVVDALVQFLEQALSDNGLAHDLFLLKHVRRHSHGFVSLKLLAGYKQPKKLNCDWHGLSVAAKQSKLLEVNADGRKVRRIAPLPETLLHVPPSRVIAVVNLSTEIMSMEGLASEFGKYGNVASLHLIRHKPGGGVPEELQVIAARVPEVAYTHCAVVQYEDIWGVAKALKEFSDPNTSIHVLHNKRKQSNPSNSLRKTAIQSNSPHRFTPHSSPFNKRRECLENEWRKRLMNQTRRDSTGSETEDVADFRKQIKGREDRKPRASLPNINLSRRFFNPTLSLPNSPQMNRKSVPSGATRNPKGPDGTRGFHVSSSPTVSTSQKIK